MAVRITKKLLKELEENPTTISSYDAKTIKKIFDKMDNDYHNKGISFLSDDVYDNLKDIVLENSKKFADDVEINTVG